MKIACPSCAWEPPPSAMWTCACGHDWHTFDTGGRCPACARQWRDTQCPACSAWNRHVDWYHDLPPVDALLDDVPDLADRPA